MTKIVVERGGKVSIPEEYLDRYGFKEGEKLYIWPSENGLVLKSPGIDVRHVYIEATSLCNINCITCMRNVWSDKSGHMDMEVFYTIIQQLRELPHLQTVTLAGFGEPLYHPEILSMVQAIKDLGVELTISTNGILLDSDIGQRLIDAGLDKIIVSLDSGSPELFADIRSGVDLNIILNNLIGLNKIKHRRQSKHPVVGIEFVAMRRNISDIADLPRLGSLLSASFIIVTNLLPHTEDMKGEVLYDVETRQAVSLPKCNGWPARIGDSWLVWGTMSHPRMYWGADRSCRFVDNRSLVIGWDGGVSPCYALMHSYRYYISGRHKHVSRYTIGNVSERKLSALWTSEEYVRFRDKVLRFAFPSCVECGIDCGYTNANQDCWGSDPSCADCLYAQGIIKCP